MDQQSNAASSEADSFRLQMVSITEQLNIAEFSRRRAEKRIEELSVADNVLRVKELTKKVETAAMETKALSASNDALRQELEAAQHEIARITGQHNSKQRIQQHMKVKKELEEQAVQIKHYQNVIQELCSERDAARDEAKKHRQMYKDASLALGSVAQTIASSSSRRLSDPHSNTLRKDNRSHDLDL